MDDDDRSQLCVSSQTGYWQYSVLKGNGEGQVYTGGGTITTGNGYMRLIALPAGGYNLNLTYYTTVYRAVATFACRPCGVGSTLYDKNTQDDEVRCRGITPHQTKPHRFHAALLPGRGILLSQRGIPRLCR